MRNMSFMLTTKQIRDRTKFVTRRLGWLYLVEAVSRGEKPEIMGCEKCMGRRAGEPLVRLGPIQVVGARFEPLNLMEKDAAYGASEVIKEGFPNLTPTQFIEMFCKSHKGCRPETTVTRIEFAYIS